MTAEDLEAGDLEYVDWAGEAKLLEGMEAELMELDHASCQLSYSANTQPPTADR